MAIEIFDVEQGSEPWFQCRKGLATASEFATVMAKGKDGGASVTRKKYLYKLAGEIISGEPASDGYANGNMERGKIMEEEAADFYGFTRDVELVRVGFMRNGSKGASPDRLIGKNGLLQVKTSLPHILIELLLKDQFPIEHMAQCQGELWVSEREWLDLIVYWPNVPKLVKRITRDDKYIATMSAAVDLFNSELADVVGRVRKLQ